MTRLEPETELRNFLRSQLTDHNSAARSGTEQWIYDDWPQDNLNSKAFPRVAVIKLREEGGPIGIRDDDTWDEVLLQVSVLVHEQTGVVTITHTSESVGTISNSPKLSLDYRPSSVTNIKHTGTAFTNTVARVNDSEFSAGTANSVEWSRSTGNLYFNTSDLTTYGGETISATYQELLDGEALGKRVARDVVLAIKDNWRDSEYMSLWNPRKVDGPRVLEYDRQKGWHHVAVTYRFNRYNTGEEV